jgi:rRNA maturation protein Nop10
MSRLINDDELKKSIHEKTLFSNWQKVLIETVIDDQPTVDAVLVVHGRWIIRDNPGTGWYRITCSECGEDVTATAPCIGFVPNAKVNWNYCPECGARMDEEREEHE